MCLNCGFKGGIGIPPSRVLLRACALTIGRGKIVPLVVLDGPHMIKRVDRIARLID